MPEYLVTLVRNVEQIARVTVGPTASPEEAEYVARQLAAENPSAVAWGHDSPRTPHEAVVRQLANQ